MADLPRAPMLDLWLTLSLERVTGAQTLWMEGMPFTECAFVRIAIDGEALHDRPRFSDAWVVFEELEKSAVASGRYLIFTCSCGIAEDGGWEGVEVEVGTSTITWRLEAEGEPFHFVFERGLYVSEIEALRKCLAQEALPLQPQAVIFPEHFQRDIQTNGREEGLPDDAGE
ncbi:hypothetical protein OV208_28730 [Corallococcus sp. bb12-1]|uniref:hypothetical protein n=1 Tax=Corallococcus sp. bb12-1 TaxID=2996784 RepID=UPI002270F6C6|nr:hypothetical protein [Corallococcus sp. bb12-1]MCY1045336.1 hypothetical protein [Corallococcus sp. bb12-1]